MSVKWIEDVDSGELFPVVEDDNFDIPEHLKDADYNEVDYDKTTQYTIEQLQNQLIAAQNQIESARHDSDVSSSDTPCEPPAEVSKHFKRLLHNIKFIKFSWYGLISLAVVFVLGASVFGLKYLSDNCLIELRTNENLQSVNETNSKVSISPVPVYGKIPAFTDGNGMYYYIDRDNSADSKTETSDTDTAENDESETENNSFLNYVLHSSLRLLFLLIPIIGIYSGLKFMIKILRGC